MSEQQKPLRLGDERPWGETTCGFGLTKADCDRPATTHVLWLESLHVSNACDEHLSYIQRTSRMPFEVHTFAKDCGMPGSLWHRPYEDEAEGYCFFPAPDDLSLLVEITADAPMEAQR